MKINSEVLIRALNLKECPDFDASGISIDSRKVKVGDLFFGIKGSTFDGNNYANEAILNGAVAAIIDNPECKTSGNMILVDNVSEALKKLGIHFKNSVDLKSIIGITGSVGKTTTKEWLSQVLNSDHKCFASIKNYNTMIGIPISLSLMENDTEFGIFEMGTNNPGEILELTEYLTPDIAIITNVFESHIGRFRNKMELVNEKLSIIDGLKEQGILIHDGDSEYCNHILQNASEKNIKTISVGFSNSCDFYIKRIQNNEVFLKTPDGIINYKLGTSVKHFAYISACVAATIFALGLPLNNYLEAFSELSPIQGRGSVSSYEYCGKTFNIIDDSYNASPSAVIAALESSSLNPSKRKIAVIGQMGELGAHEGHYHKIVAEKLKELDFYKVFFIGNERLHPLFIEEAGANISCFEKICENSIAKILEIVENEDIILLKGSRSIELNRFIDYIK